ncbi:MAG: carbon-nitrogen hydrolase family protein [Leptospiraceae bacterium]|nr:carbon-nitrogen hydrolase family protein [Leptospiraceae bacterium]MDW7976248.1 carbon-nitrogen hydrolase family protein [Leptospiraceae bacterium]
MNSWSKREVLKIGIAQYEINPQNPEYNLSKIEAFLKEAQKDILILPEMGITGYWLEKIKEYLKEVPHYIEVLKKYSLKYSTSICTTLPYKEGESVYNRLFFITPDGFYHYDKHYLIDWGGFHEGSFFQHGKGYLVTSYFGWIVGFAVCYDLRFPEHFYYMNQYSYDNYQRFMHLILLPSQWPSQRREHFLTLSKARAIENQAYFVAVNNIGNLKELSFSGDSRIYDPNGNEILCLNSEEGVFVQELSLELVKEIQTQRPILKDRYKIYLHQ